MFGWANGKKPDGVRHEADGDTHGWLKVDSQFQGLLNAGNLSDDNATFDGYGVRLVGSKRISFAHLVCRYSPRFPLAEQRIALVLSAASFLAGLIFCSRVLLFP